MKFGIMAYGIWLSYFWPRALLIQPEKVGYQQYRWLKFYFCIPRKKVNNNIIDNGIQRYVDYMPEGEEY